MFKSISEQHFLTKRQRIAYGFRSIFTKRLMEKIGDFSLIIVLLNALIFLFAPLLLWLLLRTPFSTVVSSNNLLSESALVWFAAPGYFDRCAYRKAIPARFRRYSYVLGFAVLSLSLSFDVAKNFFSRVSNVLPAGSFNEQLAQTMINAPFVFSASFAFFVVNAFLALLLIIWCHHAAVKRTNLRLTWMHQAQFAGFYVARDLGFFEDHGVIVTLLPSTPNQPLHRTLRIGADDFTVMWATEVVNARLNNHRVRSILLIFEDVMLGYFAKKTSGIRSPADFKGKTVARKKSYEFAFYIQFLLKTAGLSMDDIELRDVGTSIESFITNDSGVDVWAGHFANEPILAEELGEEVIQFPLKNYGMDCIGEVLVARDDLSHVDQALVHAVVQGSIAGWRYCGENIDEVVDIVLRYANDPQQMSNARQHQQLMLETCMPSIANRGHLPKRQTDEMWRKVIACMSEFDEKVRGVDPEDCYC